MRSRVLLLTRAGMIAALYVLLTWLSAAFGLSSGAVQFRISEALCLLPVFFPEAVGGLACGCLLANLLFGGTVYDMLLGTAATLLAGWLTYRLRAAPLPICALPPILCNALAVPLVLFWSAGTSVTLSVFLPVAGTVALGEAVCAGVLGTSLAAVIRKNSRFFHL